MRCTKMSVVLSSEYLREGTSVVSRKIRGLLVPPSSTKRRMLLQPCKSWIDCLLSSHFIKKAIKGLEERSHLVRTTEKRKKRMTFESSLLKDFCVVVGHLITLVYPLYGSIVASNSNVNIQEWLMYWVLFALITVLDLTVANVLEWIPIWPYAKVMITCCLVFPCSNGAAYVYVHFLRPCLAVIPEKLSVWFILRVDGFTLRESDAFLDVAARYIQENGTEALEKLIAKVRVPNLETVDNELLQPSSPKKAKKEWSCPLCFVSTTCEENLKQHLNGRKHKTKDKELKGREMSLKNKDVSAEMPHIPNRLNVVEDSNQVRGICCSNRWRNPPIRFCSWEKPSNGWIKLNTDGSIDPTNAGFGGLLRDHLGSPICAFVSKAARDGICLLELWAIWRGLVLARGEGIKFIWVESDSLSVVKNINKEQPYSQKAGSCLKHIWDLLKKFEDYKISHTFREANRAADHLAKMNIDKDDVVFWPIDFPRPLCKIIKDDAEGKKYPRVQY